MNVQDAILSTGTIKSLLQARKKMRHCVTDYLAGGFSGVPLVLSEWGVDTGDAPWGSSGIWARSLAEADMMLVSLELGEAGIVAQSSRHTLVTHHGHAYWQWNGTHFVATPTGVWFSKWLEAARGGSSVRVGVESPELVTGVPSVTGVAFLSSNKSQYNVLAVNKLNETATIAIKVDGSGGGGGGACSMQSYSEAKALLRQAHDPLY